MAAPNVDLALVIDTSSSMRNCFDQLRQHLGALLAPMQGTVSRISYALVGLSASGSAHQGLTFRVNFLHGPWDYTLYNPAPNEADPHDNYFTDDPAEVEQVLATWEPSGNEDMLLALDIAADLPFGPISNTKRVIALFSDEPFEGGVDGKSSNRVIPALQKKLMARHIQLFAAIPEGRGAFELSQTDRSEIEFVSGGDGLKAVDFKQLLSQMGKSISGAVLQAVADTPYQRALFGQDKWVAGRGDWSDKD